MAKTIYGPDGSAISVMGGNPMSTSEALQKLDKDAMDMEIAKRVKSQGTTLSQVWDPSRGKPKPTSVTYQTLRMMAQRCEWVAAVIKTRKNQIGGASWSIMPKDEEDDSRGVEALCQKITNLLKRPSMHGSRPTSRSWRQFLNEVLVDVLVLDQGCIEKEWTIDKWIAALYPVDGATIAPNMDERGGYHDDAYVQVVDGQITARFGIEDLIFIMDNPQTDVRFSGFGFSPLENLIVSVTAELYASKYNASYFEKGAVPEGLINLGPEAAPEDVNAFRLYWMNEIMGRPWAIPIVGGSQAEWIPWRASNKDMEYMAYQEWLLKKVCANYQITPKELGMVEDVNRSTAESEDSSEQEKGIVPLLTLIADYFEVEIIGEHGLGIGDYVEFKWDEEGESEDAILNRFSVMIPMGAAKRSEFREALGMEPGDSEGLDEFFTDQELNLLPSTPEDIEALSPAAQQQKKSEEAQERLAVLGAGGGAPGESQAAPEFGSPEAEKMLTKQQRSVVWDKSIMDMSVDELRYVAKSGRPREGKTVVKVFDRHNPQLLERQAAAEEFFEDASRELVADLEEILQTPLSKTLMMPRRRNVVLASLGVDTDYQRPEDREKVQGMLKKLRTGIALDGDIKVNEREDGSLWITDGQHRVKAMMLAGQTHAEVLVATDPQQGEQKRANIVTAHA